MIRSKWLTGEDDLSAVRRLRQTPDDGRDGSALHVLVYEDDADLAPSGVVATLQGDESVAVTWTPATVTPDSRICASNCSGVAAGSPGSASGWTGIAGRRRRQRRR